MRAGVSVSRVRHSVKTQHRKDANCFASNYNWMSTAAWTTTADLVCRGHRGYTARNRAGNTDKLQQETFNVTGKRTDTSAESL